VIGVATSYSTKPRSTSRVRTPLDEAIKGRTGIGVDLVVFGLYVNDHKFLGVGLSVNLWTHHTLEDLIPPLGTF
jgi:hypothetical protein